MNEQANHPGGMAAGKQLKKAAVVDAGISTGDAQKKKNKIKYGAAQEELHRRAKTPGVAAT